MKQHLTLAAALAGLLLLAAGPAEAGDRDGSRVVRGTRGAGAPRAFAPGRPRPAPSSTQAFGGNRVAPSAPRTGARSWTPSAARTSTRAPAAPGSWRSATGARSPVGTRPSVVRSPSGFDRSRSAASVERLRGRTVAPGVGTRTSPRVDTGSRFVAPTGTRSQASSRTTRFAPTPAATRSFVGARGPGSTRVTGSRTAFGARAPAAFAPTTRTALGSRAVGTRAVGTRTGATTSRTYGSRTYGSRSVGSRSYGSRSFGSRSFGNRSVVGSRVGLGVGGGSFHVRPGARAGRSYRITDARRLFGGGYYYRWALPAHRFPYYARAYPRFGLTFGYGVSYYTTVYAPYFVDAVPYVPYAPYEPYAPYYEEPYEVVEPYYGSPGYAAPAPVEPAEPLPEAAPGFPDTQPQEDGAQPLPHPDFEPGLQAFLAGDYGRALERFSNVLQAEPDNGEAWLAMAHANFVLGRYAQAAAALAEAAALDAFPRGYRFDPRPLYPQEGRFDSAWTQLRQQAAARPADADVQLVRAYFHVALGERAEAREAIERVLQIRPGDETAPRLALALLPPPPPPADGGAGDR